MSDLSHELKKILDEQGLTIYGASQVIGAETDEPIGTIHERLSRWLRRPPKTWQDIEANLRALGYEIRIEKQ